LLLPRYLPGEASRYRALDTLVALLFLYPPAATSFGSTISTT